MSPSGRGSVILRDCSVRVSGILRVPRGRKRSCTLATAIGHEGCRCPGGRRRAIFPQANHFPASEEGHAAPDSASDTTRDVVLLPDSGPCPGDYRPDPRSRPGGAACAHGRGLRPGGASAGTEPEPAGVQRRGRARMAAGQALLVPQPDARGQRVSDGRSGCRHARTCLRPRANDRGALGCRGCRCRGGGPAAGTVHSRGRSGSLCARGRELPRRRARLPLPVHRLPLRGVGGQPRAAQSQLHGDLHGLRGGVPPLRRRRLAGSGPGSLHP